MKSLLPFALMLLFGVSCAESPEPVVSDHDHAHQSMHWMDTSDPAAVVAPILADEPFEQVSLWLEGPTPVVTARVRQDGTWSAWQPVEITWSEGDRHVGRLFASGSAVEIRGLRDQSVAGVELMPERRGRADLLTRDLPRVTSDETSLVGALAPASLVISRTDWGARDPGKICGNIVAPYRMSIHHTALPDSDGGDPAARMRQMQAYHIDSNGWCDIGYHFVVSQSGNIYQGRSDERRPGAHVGGQNSGNVGISLIGNYSTATPPQAQMNSTIEIVQWVSDTYQIPLERNSVKGHREWPGQTTSCPGDNLLAQLDTILGGATEPVVRDIDVWTETSGADDPLVQGTSLEKPDLLPGETFEVSIYVKNKSGAAIRGVELGYFIEEPFLTATDYVIETDAPEFGGSFVVNDADSAEGNPAKVAMGTEGALTLYAFADGETKRVRIALQAVEPSIGRADHPDVRGWIRNIDGIYAQAGFFDEPALNNADEALTAYAEHDVLSRDGWAFDSEDPEMLEGWFACQEGVRRAVIDAGRGGLLIETDSDDPCIVSPAWAAIDAGTYDQLVLRLDSDSAPHDAALFWSSTDAETFDADRAVRFEIPDGGGELVIELSDHPEWKGTIERLRFDPVEGEAIDAEIVIDALFFQASGDRTTTLPEIEFVTSTPIVPSSDVEDPTNPGSGEPGLEDGRFLTNDGCAQGAGDPTPVALVLFALVALRRRRLR